MKKLAILAAALLAAGSAYAQLSDDATAKVLVRVDPNVAVAPAPGNATVSMGSVAVGDVTGTIVWRVDANRQEILLAGAASALYKDGEITSPIVPPIPIKLDAGVTLDPVAGGPLNFESEVLPYDPTVVGQDIEGFPAAVTAFRAFGSSQPGHFSQNVTMTVVWSQTDPEKSEGEYSGRVKLFVKL